MNHLLNRIDLFNANISAGRYSASQAARRLVEHAAEQLELKVWRYASRIIMEGY